jgi:hypothetical protein
VVRPLFVALILTATLVATESSSAGHQEIGRLDATLSTPTASVARAAGDDGAGAGDEESQPIDCSIPDNQDDTGCDKGDVEDSEGAIGDSGDANVPPSPGVDTVVPRGGVQTGEGGTAAGS